MLPIRLHETTLVNPLPLRTYTSVEGVFAVGDLADSHYHQAIPAALDAEW